MNRLLKSKWLKALRSGRYNQGQRYLYQSRHKQYCCLGVLCVIAGAKNRNGQFAYGGQVANSFLPEPLLIKAKLSDTQQQHLASLNDRGNSFDQIADYIEAKL